MKVVSLNGLLESVYVPKNPVEQVDKLIQFIQRNTQDIMEGVSIVADKMSSIVYGKGSSDVSFCVRAAKAKDLLADGKTSGNTRLTYDGWLRADELSKSRPTSNLAFVAMCFDPSTDQAWESGIKPALEECGYQPVRIDKQQFNHKIDDEIIAQIRKSSLVVCDFTKHRGGVYFEAGFAMGLGVPVIFTCNTAQLKGAHFDTRQYNHIVWESSADLKEKLINRIEATIIK